MGKTFLLDLVIQSAGGLGLGSAPGLDDLPSKAVSNDDKGVGKGSAEGALKRTMAVLHGEGDDDDDDEDAPAGSGDDAVPPTTTVALDATNVASKAADGNGQPRAKKKKKHATLDT